MRNEALTALDILVGEWELTLSDAWFIDGGAAEVHGSGTIEWLGDAFLIMRASLGEAYSTWDFVFGRSDANDQLTLLYHDERGVCRVFGMTFGDGEWVMLREDPDFHQRFIATVEPDRLLGRWEMSEDACLEDVEADGEIGREGVARIGAVLVRRRASRGYQCRDRPRPGHPVPARGDRLSGFGRQ
jgi:hypothetical protein